MTILLGLFCILRIYAYLRLSLYILGAVGGKCELETDY